MALLYIVLTSLLFMCSCTSNTKRIDNISNPSSITIDLDRDDKVSVLDFFSNIDIIPLETNSESMLSFTLQEPDRFVKYNDDFYFLDDMTDEIKVFNSTGEFKRNLNFKGDGPEEYLTAGDFLINRYNGCLEVLSPEGHYINIYSLPETMFVERINLPVDLPVIHNFHQIENDIYIFVSLAAGYRMFFYNIKTSEVKELEYHRPEWFVRTPFNGGSRSPFYYYNESLYFVEIYSGDVFEINLRENKLKPHFIWDFGKYKFQITDLPENETLMTYLSMRKKISQKFAMGFQVYAENSKYYFSRFKFRNTYKHLIFIKETGDYVLFDKFSDFGHCAPMWIDEKSMYTFISANVLNKIVDPTTLNPENRAKYDKIKDDDNPVGVKYVFK